MAGMDQVETAIREDNSAAFALFARRLSNQFVLRNNFPHGRRSKHETHDPRAAKNTLVILSRERFTRSFAGEPVAQTLVRGFPLDLGERAAAYGSLMDPHRLKTVLPKPQLYADLTCFCGVARRCSACFGYGLRNVGG